MKQIELTEEQKVKILDMCKQLIPEYYNIGFYSMQSNILQISKTVDDLLFIHWFEFSWMLANEICTKYIESPMETVEFIKLYGMVCFNRSPLLHPIDYLYQEYELLKQQIEWKQKN